MGYTIINPKYFSYLLKNADESWCFLYVRLETDFVRCGKKILTIFDQVIQ